MNLEFARQQMLKQQIRAGEVLDARILEALAGVNREDFVPAEYAGVAFADCTIPLAHGQCMMSPLVEGQLLQAVNPGEDDHVLEIGTGSGFLTACLASLARQVHSIDIFPELTAMARTSLDSSGAGNVSLATMNAMELGAEPKYDVIAITASLPIYDRRFEKALNTGGRLFVIVGEEPVMRARLVTRVGDDEWLTDILFETVITAMREVVAPDHFRF
ncbi:MAG: protein-L-isoaspartate O-methyltransferase [Proteobacteria bacterium]|nr:protein-L-isoaspartate O-methyltransferase [Pseudomonadota bacterium]